jgi:WD40 repeat protein/transcriptional regulator with XRE-family HTH domain
MADEATFKEWLKQRRKALDLTQAALAHRVGCSIYTVQRIEEGVARPSRQLAELLAAGLELAPHEQADFIKRARSAPLRSAAPANAPAMSPDEGGLGLPAPEPASPYKGLRAFQETDAPDFFGREALTARLRERLGEETELARFLAVVGPSGAGKSSVVRAGLLPIMRRAALPGGWRPVVADLIPGAHPLEELEAALLRVAVNPPPSLLEQLQADERGLARAVQRILPGDDGSELLLVIDQFEELFTLVPDERVRAGFINSLFSAVADARSRLRVVITLRADFYDRPLRYLPASELLGRRTEVIGPLAADEMYQAITGPAQRHGLELEHGLVATILQDVGEQPGTLPLLQYTMTELYERRAGRLLTRAAYAASGGVFGSLARRAESLYTGLSGAEQAAARQLFLRLVAPGDSADDTRRRVLLAELRSAVGADSGVGAGSGPRDTALERVLDLYGRYRMLTFDRDPRTGEPTVEVAHEALLSSWPRLRGWLDASREQLLVQRRLLASAAEWRAAGQDRSFLARGARLAQFAALPAEADGAGAGLALTAEEQDYLAASQADAARQAAAERERQAQELELARRSAAAQRTAANRLRVLFGGAVVFLLVATALALFAFDQSGAATANATEANSQRVQAQNNAATAVANRAEADSQRATAVANGAEANGQRATAVANFSHAQAQRLAAAANTILLQHGPGELVALLSIRSLNMEYSPQGEAALEGAEFNPPARVFSGHTGVVREVAFSPDGKLLAAGSDDATVRVWDVATGQTVYVLQLSAPVDGVAFAPDGKSLATGDDAALVQLWDAGTGHQMRTLVGNKKGLQYVRFSPDGKYLLTTDEPTSHLWDVASGKIIQTFTGPSADDTLFPALSPDGKYVFGATVQGKAWLWDSATGRQIREFTGLSGAESGAYSPDGRYVAASNGASPVNLVPASEVHLWEAATGRPVRVFSGVQAAYSMAFSPDGRWLVTGGEGSVGQLWDVATGQQMGSFYGHSDTIFGVAFSPDGQWVATGSGDHSVRLWQVPTGPGPRIFYGHTACIRSVAVSPDGTQLATSSDDATARVWDVATGRELVRFTGHSGEVGGVAFSPTAAG